MDFDVHQRHAPFDEDVKPYFDLTMSWMRDHLSDRSCRVLDRWPLAVEAGGPAYFVEVDFTATLSWSGVATSQR